MMNLVMLENILEYVSHPDPIPPGEFVRCRDFLECMWNRIVHRDVALFQKERTVSALVFNISKVISRWIGCPMMVASK